MHYSEKVSQDDRLSPATSRTDCIIQGPFITAKETVQSRRWLLVFPLESCLQACFGMNPSSVLQLPLNLLPAGQAGHGSGAPHAQGAGGSCSSKLLVRHPELSCAVGSHAKYGAPLCRQG